jgi:hypothetical protein
VREIWDEGNRTLVKALRTQEGMSGKWRWEKEPDNHPTQNKSLDWQLQ